MPGHSKKKPSRPTLQAIADRAGVSRATASLILGNREEVVSRFRPATVARVRKAAKEMGYQAHLVAATLRGARAAFFALVLRGADPEAAQTWHFWAFDGQFLNSVMETARLLDLYPVLATQYSPDHDCFAGWDVCSVV